MTAWIGYARTGREQEVADDLREAGIAVRLALQVVPIRQGKRRWPDPVITPLWPNYLFFPDLADEQWGVVTEHRHVAQTLLMVPRSAWVKGIAPTLAGIERDFAARLEAIQAGERVEEYVAGDVVEVIGGAFAGTFATYRRLVERAEDGLPQLMAEVPLLGRVHEVRIDPLNARRVRA
ncbi:transcription termination/antitermination NusG family protein [Pseudoroseicyclus sp. H15]